MPYVAVNGGALTYFIYYKDGVKYYLSMGSANDFYRLDLSLEEPKTPPNRQSLGLVNEADFTGGKMEPSAIQVAPAQTANNKESWFCSNCGKKMLENSVWNVEQKNSSVCSGSGGIFNGASNSHRKRQYYR